MSAVQRLISFFSSREGSPQASAVPQQQKKSPKQQEEEESETDKLLREAGLKTTRQYQEEDKGFTEARFGNNPTYAHYFRDDPPPVAQVGGFSTQETREIPKVSYEFQRPIQPKVSPASIESPPQFENLPDDILNVLKPTTGEARRLSNTVEGKFQRGGLIIPSTAPRKPVLREQPRPAPARPAPARPPPAQPALPEPEATPSVSAPPPPPVSRNVEPQSAPTQTPQLDRPAQPISQIPDYATLTDDEEEEIQKATTDVQGATLGAETASKVSKTITKAQPAVEDAGKTIAGTSSFLAGSEAYVNPILDSIGLIGGLAGLLMGSGLFSKKPPAPPPVSIPKPQAIVIPTISQTVGGGQI